MVGNFLRGACKNLRCRLLISGCVWCSALVLIPHTLAQVDVSLNFKKDFTLLINSFSLNSPLLIFREKHGIRRATQLVDFSVESSRDTLVARQKELDVIGRFKSRWKRIRQCTYQLFEWSTRATMSKQPLRCRNWCACPPGSGDQVLAANVLWGKIWMGFRSWARTRGPTFELMRSVSEKASSCMSR